MMQKSSTDPIPSLRGIDVLKIKSEVKGQWYYLQYQGEKFRWTGKPLESWRLVCRLVCYCQKNKKIKNNLKNHTEKGRLKWKDLSHLRIGLKVDRRASNIEEKMNWEGNIASRLKDLKW